jgi:hypothetical protein
MVTGKYNRYERVGVGRAFRELKAEVPLHYLLNFSKDHAAKVRSITLKDDCDGETNRGQ